MVATCYPKGALLFSLHPIWFLWQTKTAPSIAIAICCWALQPATWPHFPDISLLNSETASFSSKARINLINWRDHPIDLKCIRWYSCNWRCAMFFFNLIIVSLSPLVVSLLLPFGSHDSFATQSNSCDFCGSGRM